MNTTWPYEAIAILYDAYDRTTEAEARQALQDAVTWLTTPEAHVGNHAIYGSAIREPREGERNVA